MPRRYGDGRGSPQKLQQEVSRKMSSKLQRADPGDTINRAFDRHDLLLGQRAFTAVEISR
jgi:hypothetical protein